MARGKNGAGEGVGKSVYLFSIDKEGGRAVFARMPFDQQNDEGETLVRTSNGVIDNVADAILDGEPPRLRRALDRGVKQIVRAMVRGGDAFVSTTVVFDEVLDRLADGKPGKAGPVDDDEDEDEELVVEPVEEEVQEPVEQAPTRYTF